MSCDNENIEYWRLVQKYSTISGLEPTIPPSQDHTDGTWSDTDLYIGELFINTFDNKIWMRTEDGIHQISGTGGTGSFVGDYVPTGGGTFSGPIFSPTMSANGMTAYLITASAFDGMTFGSSQSVYYGDGSNLTGIVATWNGGTVSNPSYFGDTVVFGNGVEFNGPITTTGDCVEINDDLCVSGGVSASYYYGDGSNLTGIVASSSNYYTEDVYLTGSTLVFDRNDTPAAYSINLDPILGTNSIQTTTWDPITNEFTIITNGGGTFTNEISEFNSLNVTTDVTATNFYGTFNGTFSNDVYTTSALLYGTDAVFLRTDGVTYSLDLSSISGGGSGSVGPIGPTGATGPQGYRAVMNLSYTGSSLTLGTGSITLPIGTPINNLGWQQGTRVRVWHSATEYMEGQVTTIIANPQTVGIDVNIDYVIGTGTFVSWYVGIAGDLGSGGTGGATPSLSQVLSVGNTSGANDIQFDTTQGLYFNNTSRLREGTIDAGYGGNKGIAQICAVGYEMKWESGSLYIMNGDGTQIREVRYTFGATPSTTDDLTKGFTIGSRWVLDNGDIYSCSDNATASSVWNLEATGIGTLEQTLKTGNTIGTQSINFGGTAYIQADGTNIELKADGNIAGDLYLNSLKVYDDTGFGPYGVEQISFSSVAGVDNTSNISLSPGQTYEAHVINDFSGIQQTTAINRTPEKTVELLIDQSTGVDTEYRRELGVNGTTNGSSVKVTDNNTLEETEIKTDKSTITLSSLLYGTVSGQTIANIGITASEITYSITDTVYYDPYYSAIGTIGTQFTTFGNEYISPNPGFPPYHRRGSFNSKSGPASGNETWAEVRAEYVNGSSYAFIRATDLGGAYPANIFQVGDALNSEYTKIEHSYNQILIESSNLYFQGIQYDQDWAANYTNRSLVDKEYVDLAVAGGGGGGGTPSSLSQVLTQGNTASTDIDMNQYQIQNVSVIDADGNVGIHTINMINASLLTLMYNT